MSFGQKVACFIQNLSAKVAKKKGLRDDSPNHLIPGLSHRNLADEVVFAMESLLKRIPLLWLNKVSSTRIVPQKTYQ